MQRVRDRKMTPRPESTLVVLLAYTGLHFCHASALRWEDWDEEHDVLRIRRKHVRGKVGPVSRKKRAPKEYPVEPELKEVLLAHRKRLMAEQAPGFAEGWMFPAANGAPRTPNSLDRAWAKCLELAKIEKRFTVHGLRYTFTDLVRRANVDVVVRRALAGHVTEVLDGRTRREARRDRGRVPPHSTEEWGRGGDAARNADGRQEGSLLTGRCS